MPKSKIKSYKIPKAPQTYNATPRKNEKGSALIVVLALIALASVLAASSVATSRKSRHLTASIAQKTYSAYFSEGAAARIQWLILNDRNMFPERSLGGERLDMEKERYNADGTIREMDYYGVAIKYRILDAASGIDISGSGNQARKNLETLKPSDDDQEKADRYRIFMNRFEDYIDANDLIRIDGMEFEEYRDIGIYPLPRNNQMEFKEEILLIPGSTEFFGADAGGKLSGVRTIAPKGMPKIPGQTSFFNASKDMVMSYTGMESEDADLVLEAREEWFSTGRQLSDSLEPGKYTMLKSKFSFNESGVYSIEIDSSPNADRAGKKLFLAVRIANQISNPGIRYYEWMSY